MHIGLFNLIAPHYCCSCGEIGAVLCEYCKYNIESEFANQCLVCGGLAGGNEALCRTCEVPYLRAWCVGKKSDELERLITAYKFDRTRLAYVPLAELLDHVVPPLPADTIVTTVPTVPGHIRERGYDHAALIGKKLASIRNYRYSTVLTRVTNARQRGANRRQREIQAKVAFGTRTVAITPGVYLLIDDVVTTGATIKYASQALLNAGATEVWVAIVARQPLE